MKNSSKVLLGTGLAALAYVGEECIRYHINLKLPTKMSIDDYFWRELVKAVTADCEEWSKISSDKKFVKSTDDAISILTHDGTINIYRHDRSVIIKDRRYGIRQKFKILNGVTTDVGISYITSYVHNLIV